MWKPGLQGFARDRSRRLPVQDGEGNQIRPLFEEAKVMLRLYECTCAPRGFYSFPSWSSFLMAHARNKASTTPAS